MTKKQKHLLARIIVAAVLFAATMMRASKCFCFFVMLILSFLQKHRLPNGSRCFCIVTP